MADGGENRTLADLIATWSPVLAKAFLDAIAKIRDRIKITAIVTMLERGDIAGAIDAVGLDPVAFRGLDVMIERAFEDGGDLTIGRIPAVRQPGGQILKVLFDVRNLRAETILRTQSSTLVTAVTEDQRVMLRQHLTAGMEAGKNPTDVARDIVGRINPTTKVREGGVLGLTSSQEEWARSYEARLASGDPAALKAALEMKLRDKRFDRTVLKAIKSGEPLAKDKVDGMVRAYRNAALKLRGDAIGRTEAMRSLHAAAEESYRQAADKGQVNLADVTKRWHSAQDFRVRDTHRALNGESVGFHAAFVSPSGASLRFPCDPDAPADETVNCRCWCEFRINYAAGLKRAA